MMHMMKYLGFPFKKFWGGATPSFNFHFDTYASIHLSIHTCMISILMLVNFISFLCFIYIIIIMYSMTVS